MIEALQDGVVPWEQPWVTPDGLLPTRMSNGKPYRGINVLLLAMKAAAKGYRSPVWGTHKRIAEADGIDTSDRRAYKAWTGLRGQKATAVILWKRITVGTIDPDTGEPARKPVWLIRYYNVFNLDQVAWTNPTGKPPARWATPDPIVRTEAETIEAAEAFVAGYPNPPTIRTGGAAFYTQDDDTVTMPPRESFRSAPDWYHVLIHELVHSTGVAWRLDAPGFSPEEFGRYGSKPYSAEELRAQMGAKLAATLIGFETPGTSKNDVGYIQFWLRKLGEQPRIIIDVTSRAFRAVEHIMDVHYDDSEEE